MSGETTVLVATPLWPLAHNPRAGVFLLRQALRLARRGLRCEALVLRPAPPAFPGRLLRRSWWVYQYKILFGPPPEGGIPVRVVPFEGTVAPGEDPVPAMGRALARATGGGPGPRVVYAQWLWTAGAAAILAREETGVPVAAMARGGELNPSEWPSTRPDCLPWCARVLREADAPLANCRHLAGLAGDLEPSVRGRIDVVYNGCDGTVFRPAADRESLRRSLGIPSGGRVALMVGEVTARKGVPEILEAWRGFRRTRPEWRLLLVGHLPEAAVRREVLAAAGDGVEAPGPVPPDRVRALLQAADLYLQPSRSEGLPNAAMEAMATGLPVVGGDACGIRELIDHGRSGWLVPPGDAAALLAAMEEAAGDPAGAARRGEEARRTILERFDPEREADRLAGLLRRVAERGARPAVPAAGGG
ncbi:MAG: glycosyltransferase [Planctomycetes bacterium]|nr:glycosyltransferase [Planctomycetota bacterium]